MNKTIEFTVKINSSFIYQYQYDKQNKNIFLTSSNSWLSLSSTPYLYKTAMGELYLAFGSVRFFVLSPLAMPGAILVAPPRVENILFILVFVEEKELLPSGDMDTLVNVALSSSCGC